MSDRADDQDTAVTDIDTVDILITQIEPNLIWCRLQLSG